MSRPETEALLQAPPSTARDDGGPVFAEPWHAEAFALAVRLHERGLFSWMEWAEALGAELRRAEQAGAAEGEDGYYRAWLSALERLLDERGVVGEAERRAREAAWHRAAQATPHGEPIVLGRDTSSSSQSIR